MNKLYALALLTAVLAGCAMPAAARKPQIEWPGEASTQLIVPSVEAGAALAAAAAIREMVRTNPFPDLFRGCSSPEQGLDVVVFKDLSSGLYYVSIVQRFDRCNPCGSPSRVLDGYYEYAVTPEGEVVAEVLLPDEAPVPSPPPGSTPAEQTAPPAVPPTPRGGRPAPPPAPATAPQPGDPPPAAAPVQSPPPVEPPAAPSPVAPAPIPPAPADSLKGGATPVAGTRAPGDAGTTADSTQVPPRVRFEVQDIHYDGWTLSGRVLMSPVAGSLRVDKRLVNTTTVNIGPIWDCAREKRFFYRIAHGIAPLARPEDLLTLEPGDWYGGKVGFPVFLEGITEMGPECIEADIFLKSECERVATQRIRAVRTLAQPPDGGVPQEPRPTPDAGSP